MIEWSEMKESENKTFALTSKGIKSLGSTFKECMHGHCDKGTFQIERKTLPKERKYTVGYIYGGYLNVVGKAYKIEEAKQIAEEYYIKRWLKGE